MSAVIRFFTPPAETALRPGWYVMVNDKPFMGPYPSAAAAQDALDLPVEGDASEETP